MGGSEMTTVKQEALNFFNAIKLKNPKLQGNPINWRMIRNYDADKNEVIVMCAMEITHLDKPGIVIGRISYWDKKYHVQSRLIRNDKFADWNNEKRTSRSSINMKNMVKIALENLVPYSIQEIRDNSNNKTLIYSDLSNIRDDMKWSIRTDLGTISQEEWYDELIHMYEIGYTPKNKSIANAIPLAIAKKDKFDEDFKYKPDVLFVHIKDDGSVTTYLGENHTQEYPNIEALPQDIMGKISVLMVTPELTFVRDVGKKENNHNLWVLL